MIAEDEFVVRKYEFNVSIFKEFQHSHYAKDYWPIVYILSDRNIKEAYVGETTDTYARISTHLKNNIKSKLTAVHLITSEKFNKSATLDIESNLIKYISGDGQFKLINGNIGLANHNYYQKKEVYWDIFKSIWNKLRAEGISRNSIEEIDNSDLFKYSPYKSLSPEQRNGLLVILRNLVAGEFKKFIIEGGAGTGKTILAVFLFKLLNSANEDFNFNEFGEDEREFVELVEILKKKYPTPKMALVVPMSSFRSTLKKVFKNVKGLNANMVIGPAEVVNDKFDIIVVDESHRLRRRVNLGAYYGAFDLACEKLGLDKNIANELDWVVQQAENTILFYDENQSIKPSDVRKEDFVRLKAGTNSRIEYLKSQFRVRGGRDYVQFVNNLLSCNHEALDQKFVSKDYEFLLFDSIEDITHQIKLRERESGLSRIIAGYSWEWKSKNDPGVFDIEIGNLKLKWNSESVDWVNSPNAINEVGCIHTTQGYDLNYAAIIFGNEITYDSEKEEIVIAKDKYFDKNGKQSINDPEELKSFILNIYKTILLRGIRGTYIYVCDKNLRDFFAQHITRFEEEKKTLYLDKSDVIPYINALPVYDLQAAAGDFSEEQTVGGAEWVKIPEGYKPSRDLFACRVVGESMNKVIQNGSVCMFRKYSGGSRNGRIVLAQHTSLQDPDSGSRYTVKEYQSIKLITDEHWRHESIVLRPLSYSMDYKEIVIGADEINDLKIVGIFECVLF